MRYRCPFCYYTITADDQSRGYLVKCAGCGKNVQIPPGRFDPGCIIGDFVILGKLGAGSIGSVYKAVQLSLDRQVALKILSPEYSSEHGIEDFLREARTAAKLSHANLVQSLAVGEEEGYCYMAMTYVNGENLKSRLRREGRIPVDEALHIVQQVAEALFYAWDEAGLIHRDVKPENIMTTDDGIIKLTDLGLAVKQSELSENMEISGTPSYMSPEQFAGGKLDTRTDIYSLGVTLYQLISGRLPFDGQNVKVLAVQHLDGKYTPLKELVPGIPPEVDELLEKMMAIRADDRFPGMEELLKAIWTLRQKTAPNKSLVPDIHTISIKRLDYEMQNESSEIKERVTQQYMGQKLLMDRFFTVIGTALAVIVLMLMLWAIFAPEHSSQLKTYDRVLYFERLSSDPSLEVNSVLEEGKKILDQIPDGILPDQKYNHQRMEWLLANLELKRAKNEIQTLKQNSRNLNVKTDMENRQITQLKQKNAKLEARLKVLSGALQTQKQRAAANQRKNVSLQEIQNDHKMDLLRRQVFALQRNFEFSTAKMLIADEKKQNPSLSVKLDKLSAWNNALSGVYWLLTRSGTRLSGFPIGSEGHVSQITNGEIEYTDHLGETHRNSWRQFSPQICQQLLLMDSAWKTQPRLLSAVCEFLFGHYGAAVSFTDNPELKETVSRHVRAEMQLLESAYRAGVPDFRKRAAKFQEELKGSKGYERDLARLREMMKQREKK